MIRERVIHAKPGASMLFAPAIFGLLGVGILIAVANSSITSKNQGLVAFFIFFAIFIMLSGFIMLFGFIAVAPNQARVLLLFGEYKGTITNSGFFWVNPFYTKKKISLRIRNFETGAVFTPETRDPTGRVIQAKIRSHGKPAKVNDSNGNPIEISAVIVWQVVNTAEATFAVDDFEDFVQVQSESALRNLASKHPYDSESHEVSLRNNNQEIIDQLQKDIEERVEKAGVKIIEARISHLAYAPEIAAAMLQRQQAQAVIAARKLIVDGAVSIVEMAIEKLSRSEAVELDEERRAAMVSNLLVVLCGDKNAQPVINTGTLYT